MKKQNNKNKPNDEKSLGSTPCSASEDLTQHCIDVMMPQIRKHLRESRGFRNSFIKSLTNSLQETGLEIKYPIPS